MSGVNLDCVVTLEDCLAGNAEDEAEIRELVDEAVAYVTAHGWCRAVRELYVGDVYPGIIGIFLVRIEPAAPEIDEWTWVIVGDVPPAYLAGEDGFDAEAALDCYIRLMREWIDAVRTGAPIDDLIPVNVEPTREWANDLASRLTFIEANILPHVGLRD
jgi:hypothetical protein